MRLQSCNLCSCHAWCQWCVMALSKRNQPWYLTWHSFFFSLFLHFFVGWRCRYTGEFGPSHVSWRERTLVPLRRRPTCLPLRQRRGRGRRRRMTPPSSALPRPPTATHVWISIWLPLFHIWLDLTSSSVLRVFNQATHWLTSAGASPPLFDFRSWAGNGADYGMPIVTSSRVPRLLCLNISVPHKR